MVFADLKFIFFFLPIFLAVYFLCPSLKYRNLVLFFFSLIFYAWGEPVYVFLMVFSIFFNYATALAIEKKRVRAKVFFVSSVVVNLLIIGVFKYLDFMIGNINTIFGVHIPLQKLPLPVGISFYTFQLMSYVADVYSGRSAAQKSFVTLGAYLAGFPQLVAGPIVRYETIAQALASRRENIVDFTWGVRRLIVGLAKKVIVANNMAFIVDNLLKEWPANYGAIGAWLILVAYALQIHYDFSGYSDMAIGMGRMLGFHYLENFNYPYVARTVTEFWRRWHMSLTTFFRDYVYIPLGGNRVKLSRWVLNILFVWTLTGLWHGAKWNFVFWGLYYAVVLIIEKTLLAKALERAPGFIAHFYTIFVFLIGWALFRIEDMGSLKVFLGTLFGANGPGHLLTFVYSQVLQAHLLIIFLVGIIFSSPLASRISGFLYRTPLGGLVADLWMVILFLSSVFILQSGAYNPFIYFRF